jgi:ArsR family transcriptional regulator
VLKPGGRLLIVDMLPHDHEEYRLEMGHVWLGFSDEHMQRLLQQAGLGDTRVETLPPAADATGPGLFIATAVRPH